MSLHILATGHLIADPRRHDGAKGVFATVTIKVMTGTDESLLVSLIAFSDRAERLLELHKADAVSVSGRGTLRRWTGNDGIEKTGLNITADQLASLKPKRKPRKEPASAGAANRNPPAPDFDDAIPF